MAFIFSSSDYTSNAQQGNVYPAHIGIAVDTLFVSNGTSTDVSIADGPRNMLITLDAERPIARAQNDSFIYLVAAEVVGFAGIFFLMKAEKLVDAQGGV